jgi:hypothetical protein
MRSFKDKLTFLSPDGSEFQFMDKGAAIWWRFDAENLHGAMFSFLHNSKSLYRAKFATLRESSSVTLGVFLHQYLQRSDPESKEYSKPQTMHELLMTFSEKKAAKIHRKTTTLAEELFAYYAVFGNKEADALADLIIQGCNTSNGKSLILSLLVPTELPAYRHPNACLYMKLYEAISRQGDVAEWLKTNVTQKHMPAAIEATGWTEFLSVMNNRNRGKTLEDSLGL